MAAGERIGIDAGHVRELRGQGLSWTEVAARLYTTRQTLYSWCKETGYSDGHTKRDLLKRRLARGMDMPLETFVQEISKGRSDAEAAEFVGVSLGTWYRWRRENEAMLEARDDYQPDKEELED